MLIRAVALFVLALSCMGFLRGGSSAPEGTFSPAWAELSLGAGGFVTRVVQYPDGTTLARNDTYGAHLRKTSGTCTNGNGKTRAAPCWQQLVTSVSLPASAVNLNTSDSGNMGVAEIVACQSNTNVLYMLFNTKLYVSTDKGTNWTATPQTTTQEGNAPSKNFHPWMACDPANPDIIYVGTPSAGMFKSTNGRSGGSATFSQVTAVGTATNASGHLICYDPNSSVVSGVTQHFWVSTYGTGVYETTNGGTSFTLTSGTPTTHFSMTCDKFSQLWHVSNSNGLNRYVTSWSAISNPGTPQFVVTDPASTVVGSNHVAAVQGSGDLMISSNNGGSWTGPNFNATFAASLPQPPWIGVSNQLNTTPGGVPYMNAGGGYFDASANLVLAAGIGVFTTPAPVTASATPWTADTVGIEQLVVNQIISPPGYAPLSAVWDRGTYLHQNPDVYPSKQFNNSLSNGAAIMGTWGIDYCSGSTSTIVSLTSSNIASVQTPATSTDGGDTWSFWTSKPSTMTNPGGAIACSTPSNFIAIGAQNTGIYYTTNGAGSSGWTAATVPGTPNFIPNYVNNRQPLAADRVTANKFYAVDDAQNFYVSTNSGATFTATGATSANVDGVTYEDMLIAVPGNAGHLFYTSGAAPGASPHPGNTHLFKSTNGGVSWTNVNANLKEVRAVGFGAARPGGGGYPAIYVSGWLNGTQCICASFDGGTSWSIINAPASEQTWPLSNIDLFTWISGDANVYGRIYAAFRGSGAAYIDVQDACPWVGWTSSFKPNQNLTGTVSLTADQSGRVPITSVRFYVDGSLIGTQTTGSTVNGVTRYTQSWNTGSVATGAHTLKVEAVGNGCTAGGTGNSFSIPITTS